MLLVHDGGTIAPFLRASGNLNWPDCNAIAGACQTLAPVRSLQHMIESPSYAMT